MYSLLLRRRTDEKNYKWFPHMVTRNYSRSPNVSNDHSVQCCFNRGPEITRSLHRSHLNEAHKHSLHCAPNHESLDFLRGFHLSELRMDVLKVTHSISILHWKFFRFWSIVTGCVWVCTSFIQVRSV